jgi:hypothetical protein
MNSTDKTQKVPPTDRAGDIEHTIRIRMRTALAEFGLRRGSWRILSSLADGPASAEQLRAQRPSDGKGRRGHGHGYGHFGRGFGPGFGRRFGERFGDGFGPRFDHFATDEERTAFVERMRAHREQLHGEAPWHAGHSHGEHPSEGEQPHHGEHPDHGEHPHHGERPNHGEHSDHGEHPHHGEHPDHGEHSHHDRSRAHRIHAVLGEFAERGWVTFDGGVATLTDEGRKTHDAAVERIRELLASIAADIK